MFPLFFHPLFGVDYRATLGGLQQKRHVNVAQILYNCVVINHLKTKNFFFLEENFQKINRNILEE